MGLFIRRYKTVFIALLLAAASPAMAQVPPLEPLNYTLRYNVYWNGLPLGRIIITAHEDSFGYAVSVDTKTRAFGELIGKQRSVAKVRGKMRDGTYVPTEYNSTSTDPDGSRVTTLRYDEEGKLVSRQRKPDDDPAWRKPVPTDQADTATDPITAFVRMRQAVHDNMERNVRDSSQRTYEGARLAEFTFRVVSRASIESMGEHVNAINIVPKRTPILGYTPKETKKYQKKGDPVIHLYFSADGRFLPLQAELETGFGTLKAELEEIK